jgi:hypothetical protein
VIFIQIGVIREVPSIGGSRSVALCLWFLGTVGWNVEEGLDIHDGIYQGVKTIGGLLYSRSWPLYEVHKRAICCNVGLLPLAKEQLQSLQSNLLRDFPAIRSTRDLCRSDSS